MSVQQYSKFQLKWYRYGYGCIVKSIQEKLQSNHDDHKILKLLWRLGLNEYRSGNYESSIRTLEKLLNMIDNSEDLIGIKVRRKLTVYEGTLRSTIHQIIGRAATQQFLDEKRHHSLELAYLHYKHAVDCMIVSLSAMIDLPNLFVEFGVVLELYGAFEAAMDMYSKVLTRFPTCRAYFTALYRSTIVGRHLGSVSNDSSYQLEVIEKTIDVLQFLLEALPPNIKDFHIVFLYARTFEVSSNPQIRFRAQGAYSSLYDLCKKKCFLSAQTCDEKNWSDNPLTWFQLGNILENCGEYLIAKDAFSKFIEEAKRQATFDKDLCEILDVPSCTTLALHYASYQNFAEAIKFAEVGLKIDRYNKKLRSLIVTWSPKHDEELKKDVVALQIIMGAWKTRCWSWGFIKRLKEQRIVELENRLSNNYFDMGARQELAYYARKKYRPQFYFEEICAGRIQRSYRKFKKTWIWQEAQRRNYGLQATELHHRYLKDPFRRELRKEVLQAVKHKFMPRKHPLHMIMRKIMLENRAISQIVRCIKAFQKRHALQLKICERKARQLALYSQYAIRIQKYWRSFIAKKNVQKLRIQKFTLKTAAKKIQQMWMAYSASADYVARRQFRIQLRNRGKAMFVFRKRLLPLIKRHRMWNKLKLAKKLQRTQRAPSKTEKYFSKHEIHHAVLRIQRFYRHFISNIWQKVARIASFHRKFNKLSIKMEMELDVASTAIYLNLGTNEKLPQHQQLLASQLIIINQAFEDENTDQFDRSVLDLEVFCLILRKPLCAIRKVVFLNCSFLDDRRTNAAMVRLCEAFQVCKSITSVSIVGGSWSANNLKKIFEVTQIGNPRIRNLAIEKLRTANRAYDDIGCFGSHLLMDYFNYTIPGISSLSLHGCSLRDEQIQLIAKGMEVNSSIRFVTLSLNWITDKGFLDIFEAIKKNSKSAVEVVDCSYNFINFGNRVKQSVLKYRSRQHQHYLLEIVLFGNRIHCPLHPIEFALSQRISAPLSIRYSEEDLPTIKKRYEDSVNFSTFFSVGNKISSHKKPFKGGNRLQLRPSHL